MTPLKRFDITAAGIIHPFPFINEFQESEENKVKPRLLFSPTCPFAALTQFV